MVAESTEGDRVEDVVGAAINAAVEPVLSVWPELGVARSRPACAE